MLAGNLIASGQKVVTTAGTAVSLMTSSIQTAAITIKALHANTNMIYVGDADVSSSNGFVLDAGEELTLIVSEENVDVYIDSDTNGEGVSFVYWYKS